MRRAPPRNVSCTTVCVSLYKLSLHASLKCAEMGMDAEPTLKVALGPNLKVAFGLP